MTDRGWMVDAACRTADRELFFHPEGERDSARIARSIQATSICRDCPVRKECASYGIATKSTSGVWAGIDLDSNALTSDWSRTRRLRNWLERVA